MLVKNFSRFCSTSVPEFSKEIQIFDRSDGVFNVQLNRPESQNSFTVPLWRNLYGVFNFLSDYPNCRSIVLSGGESKSFCSGIDLKSGITELFQLINDEHADVARKSRNVRKMILTAQNGFTSIEKCQKPVIVSIHGHCIGAGISMASCCDIRYATADSIFNIKEVDVGIAADVGILQRINRIIGNDSLARELAFTARDFSASEGFRFGFVSRIFDTKEECLEASLELASQIASKSPIAVQGTKLAMNYSRNHGVDDSLEWQATWNQSQLQTNDIFNSVTSRMNKTKAQFGNA